MTIVAHNDPCPACGRENDLFNPIKYDSDRSQPSVTLGQDSFNRLTPAELERLAILSEELGEVQQVIGKILRHGYESTPPAGGETNRSDLMRELGDVKYWITRLCDEGDIDFATIVHWEAIKSDKKKYLHHNEEN